MCPQRSKPIRAVRNYSNFSLISGARACGGRGVSLAEPVCEREGGAARQVDRNACGRGRGLLAQHCSSD